MYLQVVSRLKSISRCTILRLMCFISSSGTHWFSNLMHFMLHEEPLENAVSFAPPLLDFFPLEVYEKMPSPRLLITHRRPNSCPQEVFQNGGKVILLYRNPKDTVVSLFYHLSRLEGYGNYRLSWNCHVDNWMKGLSEHFVLVYLIPT